MTSTDKIMIRAEGIEKSYGDTKALNGVNLSVQRGEIFGLIGPDGAGKTSLMRILCGLLSFEAGKGEIAGFDVNHEAKQVKNRLGYMPQRFSLYPDLTVGENIRFFSELFGVEKSALKTRFDELMKFSRLDLFIKRRAANLSGGMKQKLALCCTLIHTPEVLILDEPTTGVDPISRIEFWEMLGRLSNQGVTILVSTPYMDEANRCNRIALIHKGNILASGTTDEINALFREKILEIRGQAMFDLRSKIQTLPTAAGVHLFGDRLHVMTLDVEACRKELSSELGISAQEIFAGITFHRRYFCQFDVMNNPDSNGVVVETRDLTRKFGKFVAVDKLNISVRRGEIFGFLGANGAGKTTAIRMLCGLLAPSSGGGRVAGFDIVTQTEKIKSRIGYMSQRFSLYNDLKVEENLEFYGGVYGLDNHHLKQRIEETLIQMKLMEVRGKLTGELPLGWKQKLALGAALMHHPDIVFLDEATGGVDPVARRAFWDLIHDLTAAGKTIFVTTHYMDEAEYCHRISIMHQSRVLVQGGVRELKDAQGVETVEELFKKVVAESEQA